MPTWTLPDFAVGLPAAQVDASLRQALDACDRAREGAVLWFAEVQRRGLYRQLGHASLQLYATQALGFSDNRYYQFKRLADDLDRLPVLREAVETGAIGWTKALQVARVATEATQTAWVAKAATTGRRELERQVRQARMRRPAAPTAQLAFDAGTQLDLDTAARSLADPPVTISLRADGVRLARYEALMELGHKLGLVPAGIDRLDLVLAGLEAVVASAAGGEHSRRSPATRACKDRASRTARPSNRRCGLRCWRVIGTTARRRDVDRRAFSKSIT